MQREVNLTVEAKNPINTILAIAGIGTSAFIFYCKQ